MVQVQANGTQDNGVVVRDGKEFYTTARIKQILGITSDGTLTYNKKNKKMPHSVIFRGLIPREEFIEWMHQVKVRR